MRRTAFVFILIAATVVPLSFCGRISSRRRTHQSRRKPSSMEVSDSNLVQESVPSYETYEYLSKFYSFTCEPPRKTGYYGDPLYDCRIFHVCHISGHASFFCPAMTKFNNYLQICDWQQKIDRNCEPYLVKEEPEYERYSHPIDHYPLPPVPLTVKYVPAPQYVPVSSEEQHYRNKYKEVREYYGPFKHQAPQGPQKTSMVQLSQPVFNYGTDNTRYSGREFYQEDEQSNKASQEVIPSPTARTVTEEEKSAESNNLSKYGNQQTLIQIPPSNNIQLLQTSSNRHRGLTEGKSVAAVAAAKATGWKGDGRSTEMDSHTLTLKNREVEDGSIIELWIPTRVKRINTS